ncbi:TetR/AcrR family transcriptional regulator [Phyllobacterium sp. 21LDTY02-6]|uniref:TetR/AcrR family transcriptional regulator n=1 Tax=unclassified Phyllobacterium TaxID=2638441 RepID=UPI0020213321|nr:MULTISPECIES: TetR/AcrR family transcriptional regulator [unclassified Phyllobacterium]MCO4315838.1 TetR/AcrR family transcriptional regulator [Phyllobacterium sp. 21LDTY02-6]MCX8282303.1 TetR/AcrR family transcriptional regulator [Phyllobacterium sp. 0TCS1.6C]MCX8292071.1 TetR/AcrR family transcriptional regulator [Phyllobacterium sp. 0TCS1.6A]
MRVSKEQAAENRARIVEVASRQFRQKGFGGIGVADVMKQAGLTHGGFYGHFASKDDLIAESCDAAMKRSAEKWSQLVEQDRESALDAIILSYLSKTHEGNLANSCTMSMLAPDIARHGGEVQARFTEGTKRLLDIMSLVVDEPSQQAKRKKALEIMAGLVGAVVLSRASDDPDFADEILDAVRSGFQGSEPESGNTP